MPLRGAGPRLTTMQIDLRGKRVLVTGGNSGIGEAMAIACADSGADVAINYITHGPAAQKIVQSIEAKGRRALALLADVSDEAQVTKMFAALDDAWGGV